MIFSNIEVDVPQYDCDITLKFPSGKVIVIQARPSNAEADYNGSLDFILPENMGVTNWIGDDMEPAPMVDDGVVSGADHYRLAKQLVIELP
jgi:hypothetical protein